MELVLEVLDRSLTVTFVVIGLWAFRTWRRRGDEQSKWLAVTFGSLAVLLLVGLAVEFEDRLPSIVIELIGHGQLVVLVLFPYPLLRFVDAFEPVAERWKRVVGAVVAVTAVLGVVVAQPEPDDPWTVAFTVFLLAVVGTWVTVLPVVGWRFWRAGRHQPTLARRRLRLLGAAVWTLSLVLVLMAGSSGVEDQPILAILLLGLVAALLLLFGFLPPRWLRQLWRRPEEQALHAAALELLATRDAVDVAQVLVPHLRLVVAARGIALEHRGDLVGADGVTATSDGTPERRGSDALEQPLANGRILVWTDRYTPFFGAEELQLLERTGLLADLALARADLLASERAARQDLAATNAELESFVYSASHDLKSPLIAMLSYVELLAADHRDGLDEEARWFLDRLATNGRYMESIIGDLLELSRIGRVQVTPETVDLAAVVADIADETSATHPNATVVAGELPVLWANGTRIRQLLQNLVDNAVTHGPPGEVNVEVSAEPAPDAGVVLVVRDDGPGIPAEYRERVFGVFERLDTQDATSGTGIGLAICRKVTESLGGRIWIGDHDGGAEFRIHLPPSALGVDVAVPQEVGV